MRVTRGALVAAGAIVLSACSSPSGPYEMEPDAFEGGWEFRSSESAWCEEHGPRIQLDVEEAVRGGFGRVNLTGTWEIDGWTPDPAVPIPLRSTFTGSVNPTTGEFELLLWQVDPRKGLLSGSFVPEGSATGELTWGYCPQKRGTRRVTE